MSTDDVQLDPARSTRHETRPPPRSPPPEQDSVGGIRRSHGGVQLAADNCAAPPNPARGVQGGNTRISAVTAISRTPVKPRPAPVVRPASLHKCPAGANQLVSDDLDPGLWPTISAPRMLPPAMMRINGVVRYASPGAKRRHPVADRLDTRIQRRTPRRKQALPEVQLKPTILAVLCVHLKPRIGPNQVPLKSGRHGSMVPIPAVRIANANPDSGTPASCVAR